MLLAGILPRGVFFWPLFTESEVFYGENSPDSDDNPVDASFEHALGRLRFFYG
jgi:hypothetical protein